MRIQKLSRTYIHTNSEINKHIQQIVFEEIAKKISRSKEFKAFITFRKIKCKWIRLYNSKIKKVFIVHRLRDKKYYI